MSEVNPKAVAGVRKAVGAHALGGYLNAVEAAVIPYGASECVPPEVFRASCAIAALLDYFGLMRPPLPPPATPPHQYRLAQLELSQVWADQVDP